jgi:hypothetical protein
LGGAIVSSIKSMKGYVGSLLSGQSDATTAIQTSETGTNAKIDAGTETGKNKKESNDDCIQDGTCCICLDAPATFTLVHGDTGHTCLCAACKGAALRSTNMSCPVCRRRVESVVRCFGT